MLRNYLKIAIRNLLKNSTYSFINIFGLSIGITCSILIMLWVHDELSYDQFHKNIDQLHQVYIHAAYDGKINTWNSNPLPMGEGLKAEDHNILRTVTTNWGGKHLLTVGDSKFYQQGYYASSDFFNMFQFEFISGSPSTAITDPHSIVLTESAAKTIFGTTDVLGKALRVDNAEDVKVTGVIYDVPLNSTFQFNCILPFALLEKQEWVKSSKDNWGSYSFQVFVELQPGANKNTVNEKIKDILTRKGQTDIKRELYLHPMKRWRLYSNFENGKEAGGFIHYVMMFSLIGIFILLIACINFMNLATARSERRAREVGIRKSVGSKRKEIILQFLGESILISLIAFIISVALAELILPSYNTLIQKSLFIEYTSLWNWSVAFLIIIVTGVLAGSYPAFYLSSFRAVRVLKGKVQVGKNATTPRKVLVVLQFVFSITLIVSSIVIQKQISHIKGREIGYNRENLITISYSSEIGKHYKTIKQELLGSGIVESVTKSNSPITSIFSNNFLDWEGKPKDQRFLFSTIATEYDYAKTMGIKVLEGRDFSEDFPSDSSAIIINKAGIDLMGLKDPIGATVEIWESKRQIVGVVDNVLMGSVFQKVSPMVIVLIPDWVSSVTVRLSATKDLQASLHKVEDIFKKYNPAYPFEYQFVDVEFEKKYAAINMVSSVAGVFTMLAIFITGLGLFGLAAFTAEQRTKEVGIRKVLGASVSNLVLLITKEFTVLVCIAFVFAAPLAGWSANKLLEQYEYHIDTPYWVVPLSGVIALVFTLLIVSTQALKAASSNPVNSLRNE
jgi:putative ABC transport system permease protein